MVPSNVICTSAGGHGHGQIRAGWARMMLVLTQYWEIGAHTSPRVRSGPKFNFNIKKLKLKLNFNMKSAKFEIELRARTTVIAAEHPDFFSLRLSFVVRNFRNKKKKEDVILRSKFVQRVTKQKNVLSPWVVVAEYWK